ncbi:MAG: hypothetical protein IH840_01370 [Candidatus Heimdallarchaeota archaeon]|nr:hypothetical protein [Candidatus Heimdallarchaeota archaeon]
MDLLEFFGPQLDQPQGNLLIYFRFQPKIIGRTRLQKLMFLYEREVLHQNLFDYTPYKYGPFSGSLTSAMDELIELGMIREQIRNYSNPNFGSSSRYEITDEGIAMANRMIENVAPKDREKVEEFIHRYGYKEMNHILEFVYSEYPEFTSESIIKDLVMNYN